jgi:hypothetical protein
MFPWVFVPGYGFFYKIHKEFFFRNGRVRVFACHGRIKNPGVRILGAENDDGFRPVKQIVRNPQHDSFLMFHITEDKFLQVRVIKNQRLGQMESHRDNSRIHTFDDLPES